MSKAIKVGVITHAQGAHLDAYLPSLAKVPETESVALADPSGKIVPLARKSLGKKLAATYTDAAEMLRKFEPQMILVSMEAVLAPPAMDAALDAGCHVLAEKPACVRVEDFERLALKAERKHRHLMLALANRVNPRVREARRLFEEGKFGKIYGVEIHFLADQARLKRAAYRHEWYCRKAQAGGGYMIWLGIHWLDLALFLTGLKVKQIAGFAGVVGGQPIDIEDAAAAALRFDNGSFGAMTAGYFLDSGKQSHIQIWGETGWLRLAEVENAPLEWYSTKEPGKPRVQHWQPTKGESGYPPFVRAAVRACAGLEPPPITPAESLHVLKALFAFYEAARTGRSQEC
ncbi:MAG TPA: Gfo/Idh/MocA family oxidoreductase [Gemmataceae bacterium]|nr:Gfo/Idh/MocA family oxidoreductase [Gemmataceae bacterium]